jgi:LPXTG-motif cell wall-anchored protein
MPDIYTQSEMISNGIFMFLAGLAIVYGLGLLLQRKRKK